MFDDVKPLPPVDPSPQSNPTPSPLTSAPVQPPGPSIAQATFEQTELFRRTGLSLQQKIGLVVISFLVISSLLGGGVWLFYTLDPFANPIRTSTNTNNSNATNNNNNSIPLQELDTDKDGLRDIDERRYNTNSQLADTDGDALSDYQEVNQYHTNPTLADTDGDTYNDKSELDNGYDPLGPGRLSQ